MPQCDGRIVLRQLRTIFLGERIQRASAVVGQQPLSRTGEGLGYGPHALPPVSLGASPDHPSVANDNQPFDSVVRHVAEEPTDGFVEFRCINAL